MAEALYIVFEANMVAVSFPSPPLPDEMEGDAVTRPKSREECYVARDAFHACLSEHQGRAPAV